MLIGTRLWVFRSVRARSLSAGGERGGADLEAEAGCRAPASPRRTREAAAFAARVRAPAFFRGEYSSRIQAGALSNPSAAGRGRTANTCFQCAPVRRAFREDEA